MQADHWTTNPLASFFIPHPVSIYISINTFVRYVTGRDGNEEKENIGLVVGINVEEQKVKIRCFLSSKQLSIHLAIFFCKYSVSFWPQGGEWEYYLCDSDFFLEIEVSALKGIVRSAGRCCIGY